jgi:aspartokinase
MIDEISPKTMDIIVGSGERLSCHIMAGVLRDRVIATRISLNTRELTDDT